MKRVLILSSIFIFSYTSYSNEKLDKAIIDGKKALLELNKAKVKYAKFKAKRKKAEIEYEKAKRRAISSLRCRCYQALGDPSLLQNEDILLSDCSNVSIEDCQVDERGEKAHSDMFTTFGQINKAVNEMGKAQSKLNQSKAIAISIGKKSFAKWKKALESINTIKRVSVKPNEEKWKKAYDRYVKVATSRVIAKNEWKKISAKIEAIQKSESFRKPWKKREKKLGMGIEGSYQRAQVFFKEVNPSLFNAREKALEAEGKYYNEYLKASSELKQALIKARPFEREKSYIEWKKSKAKYKKSVNQWEETLEKLNKARVDLEKARINFYKQFAGERAVSKWLQFKDDFSHSVLYKEAEAHNYIMSKIFDWYGETDAIVKYKKAKAKRKIASVSELKKTIDEERKAYNTILSMSPAFKKSKSDIDRLEADLERAKIQEKKAEESLSMSRVKWLMGDNKAHSIDLKVLYDTEKANIK